MDDEETVNQGQVESSPNPNQLLDEARSTLRAREAELRPFEQSSYLRPELDFMVLFVKAKRVDWKENDLPGFPVDIWYSSAAQTRGALSGVTEKAREDYLLWYGEKAEQRFVLGNWLRGVDMDHLTEEAYVLKETDGALFVEFFSQEEREAIGEIALAHFSSKVDLMHKLAEEHKYKGQYKPEFDDTLQVRPIIRALYIAKSLVTTQTEQLNAFERSILDLTKKRLTEALEQPLPEITDDNWRASRFRLMIIMDIAYYLKLCDPEDFNNNFRDKLPILKQVTQGITSIYSSHYRENDVFGENEDLMSQLMLAYLEQ